VKAALAALSCLAGLVLAGCSTLPKVSDPSGVDVSVAGLTDQKVMIYYGQGGPDDLDPYIPANPLLSGSHDALVVLRIELASIRKGFVTLDDARATDASGTVVARLYSKRDFLDLLGRQSTDEQVLTQLNVKVERTYFPDGGVEIGPGSRRYAVVLVGKSPLPTPLTVTAQISVDKGAPRDFQFSWSN
jgi:hypothetical protein